MFIGIPDGAGDRLEVPLELRGSDPGRALAPAAEQRVYRRRIEAHERSGAGGVSLKLIKLGGISGVMRGAVVCDTLGLEINLAGKIAESSIAAAANLHCAAAISDLRFGCSTGNQSNAADVTESPILMSDGEFNIPTGPGLGVEVDETMVKALAS